MKRTRRIVTVVAILLIGAGVAALATAADEAGFVAEVRGRWEIVRAGEPPLPVQLRLVVRDGDTVRKVDQDPQGVVVLALYTGVIQELTSTTALPSRSQPGALQRVMTVIQNRFRESFVKASARGGGDFRDAIAPVESGGEDLSAIFSDAPRGAYTIAVYAVAADGLPRRPAVATARMQVDDRSSRGPALAPGLYQIDISDGPAGLAGSVWLRVVPEGRFPAAAAQLAELQASGAAGTMELRNAVRAVARTYLMAFDDITFESR